jgi:hypothetical protein
VPPNTSVPTDSAARLVFSTPTTDDVGAETADRFEWQAAMAAADGLSLFLAALTERSLGLAVPH